MHRAGGDRGRHAQGVREARGGLRARAHEPVQARRESPPTGCIPLAPDVKRLFERVAVRGGGRRSGDALVSAEGARARRCSATPPAARAPVLESRTSSCDRRRAARPRSNGLAKKELVGAGQQARERRRRAPRSQECGVDLSADARAGKLDPVARSRRGGGPHPAHPRPATQVQPVPRRATPASGRPPSPRGSRGSSSPATSPTASRTSAWSRLQLGHAPREHQVPRRVRGAPEERHRGGEGRRRTSSCSSTSSTCSSARAGTGRGRRHGRRQPHEARARARASCSASARPPSRSTAQHIEKDAALERRFQPVRIGEPSPGGLRS